MGYRFPISAGNWKTFFDKALKLETGELPYFIYVINYMCVCVFVYVYIRNCYTGLWSMVSGWV